MVALLARKRLLRWIVLFGLISVVAGGQLANSLPMPVDAQPALDEKIGEGVIETIEANGEAFVVIALVSPPSLSAAPFDLDSLREEVSRLQDEVLSSLEPPDFRLVLRYEAVPALVGFDDPIADFLKTAPSEGCQLHIAIRY